jgi:hypothetical protein
MSDSNCGSRADGSEESSVAIDASVDERIGAIRSECEDLRCRHDALAGQVTALHATFSRLDEGLALCLSQLSEQVSAPRSDEYIEQSVLSERYRTFVEQRVVQAAIRYTKTARTRRYSSETAARFAAKVCAILFRANALRLDDLLALGVGGAEWTASARKLYSGAEDFHREAARIRLPFYWDFYLRPGQPLEENWQTPWTGCDPEWPARFVVSPAYVVADRVTAPQIVFTSAPRRRQQSSQLARTSQSTG